MNHNSIKNALKIKNNIPKTKTIDSAGQLMKVGYIFEGIFEIK